MESNQNEPMEKWLSEFSKESVRRVYRENLTTFLEWSNKTSQDLVNGFNQDEARSMILQFQNYLLNDYVKRNGKKGLSENATRNKVNAVRSFYTSQCEPIRKIKRRMIKPREATGEHIFSLEDLRSMFYIANCRDKAILSLGSSLGWEASAFLDLDRKFVRSLVDRAIDQKQDFIAFDYTREKTSTAQYGILTPCAIDSLKKWLDKTEKQHTDKLFNGLRQDALNDVLKRLAKEANIKTIGRIRWHLLRKWLMDTLANAGLDIYENKIILGKAIPLTDKTYLRTIKRRAFEKFQKGYAFHMSICGGQINGKQKTDRLAEVVRLLFTVAKDEGLLKKIPPEQVSDMEAIIKETNGEVEQHED